MKIKEEYLDTYISCPLTGKIIWPRELDPNLYGYYYSHGHSIIFELEIKKEKENVISKPDRTQ